MAINKRPVCAADIDDFIVAVDQPQLGVAARDFGVVKTKGIRGLPADSMELLVQVKLLALIGAMNDDEPRHKKSP